jgi:hypothetical protein
MVAICCANANHDHYEHDHAGAAVPLICHDCGRPAFYDYETENYRHTAPEAPTCFLIRYTTPAGACDLRERVR